MCVRGKGWEWLMILAFELLERSKGSRGVSADEGDGHVEPWCSLSSALGNIVVFWFAFNIFLLSAKYTGILWVRSHYYSVVDVNSLVKGGRIRKSAKYNTFSINYTFKSRKGPMFR